MIDKINARYVKLVTNIGMPIALLLLLVDKTLTIGVLVGCMVSTISQYLLTYQMTMIVDSKKSNVLGFIVGFVLRMGLMLLALLIGVLYPAICNVWGVFFSILACKVVFYFISSTTKEEEVKNGN